jgi:uncharacterized membrane protein YgaE (UPF0421/DUF939 family)
VAASVAYFLATFALGIQESFYAPIAAVVCLSLTLGEPWRRVLLVTIGVTLGLGIASLIVLVIGIGTAQITASQIAGFCSQGRSFLHVVS